MPTYQYRAIDQNGQRQSGSVDNVSREAAAKELAKRGWIVQEVVAAPVAGDPIPAGFGRPASPPPAQPEPATNGHAPAPPDATAAAPPKDAANPPRSSAFKRHVTEPVFGKPPLGPLAFFFRQLAAMLNAGVNPVSALDTMISQTPSAKLRPVITAMRDAAQRNEPLSSAMRQYPAVFTPLMISLCVAGEEGGFQVDALRQCADYIEKEVALRNMIRRATFLPKIQLLVALGIIGGANAIANSVAGRAVFDSPLNRLSTWYVLGPLLIGLFLFFRSGMTVPSIKHGWDRFVANIPIIGTPVRQFAMAKFGRSLGALYRGGVAIPTAIQYAADSCGNEHIRQQLLFAPRAISQGASIGESLAATGALSPTVLNMIRTGEATGNLDGMLNSMADYYEEEAGVRAIQLSHVLTVCVALFVIIYLVVMILGAAAPVVGAYREMGDAVFQ
jgi:type II secretory pathway component PulF